MTVWKEPADMATTEDLGVGPTFPASGAIDGVTLKVGNRVLVKDQLTPTENGYYKVVAGVPPTLTVTGETIEAEAVIRVNQGDRNAYTAWALIDATNRVFVRHDVKHYSLKSIDALKHLWQVLPDATATVACYAERGDRGGGDFTFIGVLESARVVNATPESRLIKTVADVDGVVTITTSTPHDLGDPNNITTTYISGVTGLANKAYSVRVVNTDTLTINANAPISGASFAAGAQIQYVRLVTAGRHGRATGQRISVSGVAALDAATDIRGVIDLSGVIDSKSLSIPIATTDGTYVLGSHAVIGDDGITVPATDPAGTVGGLWQRLCTDHFDVRWFGAKSNWDGTRVSDDGTANLAAFEATLAAAKADTGNSHAKIVTDGHFYLSGTLHIHQTLTIEGTGNSDATSGVGAQRSGPGTWLVFPTDCDGIHFHHQGEVAGGSDFSTIRHLTLYCKYQRDGDFPPPAGAKTGNGMVIRCPVYVDHVSVENFAQNGILVSAGHLAQYHDGNAGGFQITKCRSAQNGMNGYMVEGGDATVGLVSGCSSSINHGWGFKDTTIATTYLACHAEANRGFRRDIAANYSEYYIRNGVDTNASLMLGCYAEGTISELDSSTQCIGGTLALKQYQIRQDLSQGLSASIGARNAVAGVPLSFENTSGVDTTLIEFGSKADIGTDGIVLNFSTPARLADHNALRWNNSTAWWNIYNVSTDRISICFPTTVTKPRRIAPLLPNGVFYGTATVAGDATTSKSLINHIARTEIPTDGTWEKGDVVWNSAPTPGGNVGWVCTTAGTTDAAPAGVTGIVDVVDGTKLTLSVLPGTLAKWQYITIAGVAGVYQIVNDPGHPAPDPDLTVRINPAAPVGARPGTVDFSHATFSTFGIVDSPSKSYASDKLLTLADRYVTVAATGGTMTLPASPVDGQAHSIKSQAGTPARAGVTTTVKTQDSLKIDGQDSVTLAPGELGTFRYSVATGEWETR